MLRYAAKRFDGKGPLGMDEPIVGWLTSPRGGVYHPDQEHASSIIGDGGLYPVTASEVAKFELRACTRCITPKEPEANVVATAAALRKMFVVEGTEAEVTTMAEDFLTDLREQGFTVNRIRRRKTATVLPDIEDTTPITLLPPEPLVPPTAPEPPSVWNPAPPAPPYMTNPDTASPTATFPPPDQPGEEPDL